MANCCVAKQSHRTQSHPTPASKNLPIHPHNPSISPGCPSPLPLKMPLTTVTFSKLWCQQQSCHGWWCCRRSLSRSPLLLSLSLPVFLAVSLSRFYFWYFCSWAELLTRSFCVDCPHPRRRAGLWFEFVLLFWQTAIWMLHNFYLYLPCCFCHLFFSLLLLTLLL